MTRGTLALVTAMWLLGPLAASAGTLSYDAFCDREGHISNEQVEAAQIMVRDSEQLETLYAAAMKGDGRAARAFHELETILFPAIGQEVANRECLTPIKRELVPGCIPDWSFIGFLRADRPGGARLRKALADAHAVRMRERGQETRLLLASINAILAVSAVGTVGRQAATAAVLPLARSSTVAGAASSGLGDLTVVEVEQIQSVVERAGRPLEVVGSAARGGRRGVGADLPIGKGPGTRSDIDYLVPPASASYFTGLASQLPGIDAEGLIVGTQNPFIGPAVRFEPGAAPRLVPGAKP